MAHLVVAGHFGMGNLGDDAILLGFVNSIGEDFELTVMSGSPEETYRLYGLNSIPRMEMDKFRQAMEKADALVFAGGSIFQDVTSVKSVAYYAQLVKIAKKAGKRVFMVGQGVGPLNNFFGKRMAAQAFNSAQFIVVRDPMSAQTLKNIGVTAPVRVGADLAYLMPPRPAQNENEGQMGFSVGNMRTVGLVPRPLNGDKKTVVQLFGELARLLFGANYMPVLIELDRKFDGPLLEEISKAQGGKVPDMRKLQTPMQVQERMSRMDSVISMRLHGGILATTVGIPPLMISYDPKVAAFSRMMDLGTAISIEKLTPQRLFEAFLTFDKERDRNVKIIQKKREELQKAAELNVQAIRDSLKVTA